MPVPIWLVAVFVTLTSCGSGIGSLTAAEEDPSSLQYIHAFFRHGIRSPLYKPFPNDPNKSKYHEYFPGPRGQLTKVGKQVMYNVGKKLKERYGKFLGDFSDEKVHISSTDTSRTIMTALTMMAGLFPPSKPILEDLKWQPVPVWQDSRDFDKAYLYNDEHFPKLAIEECPKYGALIKRGCDKVDHPDKTKGRHKFYKLLKNYTGQMDLNSLTTHYHIWDTLQFESLNGLPLPSWSSTPQPDFNNKPLYPDIMEPIMVEWFKDTQYLNNNTEMLHFYSGPLLNTVHKHMGKKIKSPRSHEIMRLHATHDTTLFVFLWAFGLREPAVVGPGDGVIFELHKINETEIVKVLYYDTNHDHQVTELALPFCPAPCLFHQFIRSRPGLTPEQWRRECQN